MRIIEMKAIRSMYYTHVHFVLRNPSTSPVSLFFLSRHFHSLLALNSSVTDGTHDITRVCTVYQPATGEVSTPSSKEKSTDHDIESGSGDEANADFETERTYGMAQNANLSNGDKTLKGFSGFKNRVPYSPKENTDGISRKKAFSDNGLGLGDIVGNKKKEKGNVRLVCEHCGYSDGQWWGVCRFCDRSGTMKRFSEGETKNRGLEFSETVLRSWLPKDAGDVEPVRLINSWIKKMDFRIPLFGPFGNEVARVLGGGLVPGSLVLIGGDPGSGKSTLLLQMAALIAQGHDLDQPASVVVLNSSTASSSQSVEQISSRAECMKIGANELYIYFGTDIEDILVKIKPLSPLALIVDSAQTVYLKEVRECASALLRFAKKTNIPVLLAAHVTKSGDIAGPRVLEHIVDTVLFLEGEKCSSHRLLRSVKNCFGSTDELGVFEMSQLGLQAVSNPSEMFLSDQNSDLEFLPGLAVAVIMDGSRAFLIEIQALCVSSSKVSVHVNGIKERRAVMIIAKYVVVSYVICCDFQVSYLTEVLYKKAGLKIQGNTVFLNVVSGVSLKETAGDLAIAASICSSLLEFPIPNGVAFIVEIGLGGELRIVPRMDKRVSTAAKLGYKKCVVPMSAKKSLATLDFGEMQIIGCKDLKAVINTVFTKQ
ncbi:hypothetical protein CRYUN_Cryun34aG0070900 [Craigia yunnanensis]